LPPPPPPPLPPGARPSSIKRPPTPVINQSVPVDVELATSISKVWIRCLQRTRYGLSGDLYAGDDGCIYTFGMGSYIGMTWSPSGQIPAKLVELSDAMIELTNSNQPQPSTSRSRVLSICTELSAALDTESPTRWP
jgi:hypothetical protein